MAAAKELPAEVAIVPRRGELIEMALSKNATIEQLERLLRLQEQWEAGEARKAFVQAMSDFKAHSIVVLRDKTNPQYNSRYVSLGNLVSTVTPYLSQHGLSVTWEIDQSSGIKVSCKIQHALGHAESVAMVVPPDTSGSKNPIQQIKSAITYAKACTFESICGLASTDANLDDDGNSSGARITDVAERVEFIANCADLDELKRVFMAHFAEAKKLKDTNAMNALVAAKNKRYKELA